MDLNRLSDESLVLETKKLVRTEREATLGVLHHLREIERRSLYAKRGFPSLFEYAVKELGYSESAAQRRISSMRLLRAMPELEKKVEEGELSLSTLSRAQSFFRVEKINEVKKRKEVLEILEGKSSLEVERELISRSSQPERIMNERVKAITSELSKITLIVEEELMKDIEELRNHLARSRPGLNIRDVVKYAISEALKKVKPKDPEVLLAKKSKNPKPLPISAVSSRYISQNDRRKVWQRDRGSCSYRDLKTGRKCNCQYGVQIDHIIPHAMGGKNTEDNLRLRCFAHNQLEAIHAFGRHKMENFVPRMRAG